MILCNELIEREEGALRQEECGVQNEIGILVFKFGFEIEKGTSRTERGRVSGAGAIETLE
jgi:hypothetical protein